MRIFISWSGERSRAVAEALRDWLPKVIQSLEPWISSKDIGKGAVWVKELTEKLQNTHFGILCITEDNQVSPWLHFEAGALAKVVEQARVCPLLIGLEKSALQAPLSIYQATSIDQADMLELMLTMNKALGSNQLPETALNEAFEVWWSKLEENLKALPAGEPSSVPKRSDSDLLKEILDLVRGLDRRLSLAPGDARDSFSSVVADILNSDWPTLPVWRKFRKVFPRDSMVLEYMFGAGKRKSNAEVARHFDMKESDVEDIILSFTARIDKADSVETDK